MPCLTHEWFYLSGCPKCVQLNAPINAPQNESGGLGSFSTAVLQDIMDDLTDVTTYSATKPKSYRQGNLEKSEYLFTHRILVEGETYILTEALNNQPRARWLTKTREQAAELLAKRKKQLEDIFGGLYAGDETIRLVIQSG